MARIQETSVFAVERHQLFDLVRDPARWSAWFPWPHSLQVHSNDELQNNSHLFITYQWKLWNWFQSRAEVQVEEWLPDTKLVFSLNKSFCPLWRQSEIFETHGENQTRLTVIVDYELPYGLIGKLADDLFFTKSVHVVLKHRFQVMREQLNC